jgi:uncharacterized membrane protein
MSAGDTTSGLPFGPVQLLVLGFERTEFDGTIMPEIERLKDAGIIRLIDLLFVTNRGGEVETIQTSDLSTEEAEEFGAIAGALIGFGAGEESIESAMGAGAAEMADGHVIDQEDVWYIADAIPEGTSAAIALIEHHWAIPLRDKILAADGIVLADEWVHPKDLIAAGAAARAVHDAAESKA